MITCCLPSDWLDSCFRSLAQIPVEQLSLLCGGILSDSFKLVSIYQSVQGSVSILVGQERLQAYTVCCKSAPLPNPYSLTLTGIRALTAALSGLFRGLPQSWVQWRAFGKHAVPWDTVPWSCDHSVLLRAHPISCLLSECRNENIKGDVIRLLCFGTLMCIIISCKL